MPWKIHVKKVNCRHFRIRKIWSFVLLKTALKVVILVLTHRTMFHHKFKTRRHFTSWIVVAQTMFCYHCDTDISSLSGAAFFYSDQIDRHALSSDDIHLPFIISSRLDLQSYIWTSTIDSVQEFMSRIQCNTQISPSALDVWRCDIALPVTQTREISHRSRTRLWISKCHSSTRTSRRILFFWALK